MSIVYEPIGIVHSPHRQPVGVPIQGALDSETEAELEIFRSFAEGLKDIEGFSHLIVVYHFHAIRKELSLVATPFLDDEPHGVFAIRTPVRPNPIGLTVVRLLRRTESRLRVTEVDMIDGTPILDLKPFVPRFDCRPEATIGWIEGRLDDPRVFRSDDRFNG